MAAVSEQQRVLSGPADLSGPPEVRVSCQHHLLRTLLQTVLLQLVSYSC